MEAVLQEIEQTEEGYCRDVEELCSFFVEPLRQEQVLSKEEMLAVFSNCETIRGVNERLLAALQEHSKGEPVQHLAAAFIRKIGEIPPPPPYALQALTAFDELKGVLDALNRRVQLAEADEERRRETLQQWRAGSHAVGTASQKATTKPRPGSPAWSPLLA